MEIDLSVLCIIMTAQANGKIINNILLWGDIMVRACDLKQREVINVINAERLGYVYDVDIEFETGRIRSLIIPKRQGIFGIFSKKNDYVIPWERIVAVGKDIVLVKIDGIDVVK